MNRAKKITWKHSLFSGIGLAVIIVILDAIPAFSYDSFLYLSFASGLLGFWGIASLLIMLHSENKKSAARNVFCFLAAMSLTYYLVEGFRDSIISYITLSTMDEAVKESMGLTGAYDFIRFNWSQLLYWLIITAISAAGVYCICLTTAIPWLNSLLAAIPFSLIMGEGIEYTVLLFKQGTGLAPVLVNITGLVICYKYIADNPRKKILTPVFMIPFTLLYFIFWTNWLF